MILHGHGQKGLGTVTGTGIESPRAGEIEPLCRIGIGDIDCLQGQGAVGGDHGIIGLPGFRVQGQILEFRRQRLTIGTAKGNFQGIRPYNLKAQMLPIFGHAIESPPIGMGDLLGSQKNPLQQALQVALMG